VSETLAGREFDALIAHEVMGWSAADMRLLGDLRDVPHYSTDIAASWKVVAAMEKRGYWCQMRTPFGTKAQNLDDGYWCGFTPHGTSGWNGTPDHWTSASTLPHAICLAALAAMERVRS